MRSGGAVAGTARTHNERRPRPAGDAGAAHERRLSRLGYRAIAGLDEAGRGSWAGPLVAAAVVLPPISRQLVRRLRGLRDSKQLSAAAREHFYGEVRASAVATGVGVVTAPALDLLGLTAAGQLAMERAVRALPVRPDFLLIDAFRLPSVDCPQEAIIFGDALCLTIAAASIIAKVERDRLLDELGERYPGYGFERNKGYGTREHAAGLQARGLTLEHRRSYAPIRAILDRREHALAP